MIKSVDHLNARAQSTTNMAVVIVNHNTCDQLRHCLASIQPETRQEVIVVDNASTDCSTAMVETEYPWVDLHRNERNVGYGTAANQAIARCQLPYILLLNSDTRPYPGAIHALGIFLEQHPQTAIVGPRLVNLDGSLQPSCYPMPTPYHVFMEESTLNRLVGTIPVVRETSLRTWSHNRSRVVPWVLGAAVAIRRAAFIDVGGFDPSFFMFAEEIDLCYRLREAGWEIRFSPQATISHVGGASTRLYRADMAEMFFHSMVHFYRLHYSPAALTRFLVVMKTIVFARLLRDLVCLPFAASSAQQDWIKEGIRAWRNILLSPPKTLNSDKKNGHQS